MIKHNEQLLKFQITNDKLKMEIKLTDLVWLFHNSPNNLAEDGEHECCKVKRGLKKEFAEEVVKILMDQDLYNENDVIWGAALEKVFEEIMESGADFLKYRDF